jgi:hypothetical protein
MSEEDLSMFAMNVPLDAEVTVRFRLRSICDRSDLAATGETFDEMVRYEIEQEGLIGLIDDAGVVLSVKVWRS